MTEITDLETRRPHAVVLEIAIDELHRVVTAIAVEGRLGNAPPMSLRIDGRTQTLALVVDGDLNGLQLALLQELCGQNLDVRHRNGRLEVFCPSVEHLDQASPPGERFRDNCR